MSGLEIAEARQCPWCCEGLAQYAARQMSTVLCGSGCSCAGSDTEHVRLQTEKVALEALVFQQTHAIEVLKEEAAALRRDLAFVGQHININVAPVNPALEALQPLPALEQEQEQEQEQAPTSAPFAEGSTSAIGAGFATEVGGLLCCRRFSGCGRYSSCMPRLSLSIPLCPFVISSKLLHSSGQRHSQETKLVLLKHPTRSPAGSRCDKGCLQPGQQCTRCRLC